MFCSKCGTKIRDGVKFCSECGTAVVQPAKAEAPEQVGLPQHSESRPLIRESATPSRTEIGEESAEDTTSGRLGYYVGGAVLAFLLGLALFTWFKYPPQAGPTAISQPTQPTPNRPATIAGEKGQTASKPTVQKRESTFNTGNVANDRLLALTEREQAFFLGTVVNEGCVGNRAFYRGIWPKDRSAYWSVGCTNGASYGVKLAADAVGSTKIVECSVLKAVGINCFEKIKDQ